MADHLGTDLHQFLPQRGQRPVLDIIGQGEFLLMAEAVEEVPRIRALEIRVQRSRRD